MNILAVDSSFTSLHELITCLHKVYPEAEVIPFQDPLLAIQFAFHHPVDMIYTEIELKHLNGLNMVSTLRARQQGIFIYYVSREGNYLLDITCESHIVKPVTPEKILQAAKMASQRQEKLEEYVRVSAND